MTALMAAAERMARAVERLEAAARQRSGERHAASAPPESEQLARERRECERLSAELGRARSDLAQLETVTDGVSLRLEDAIERIRAALDG